MRLLSLLLLLIFVRDMGHTEGEACKRAPQEYKHTHHTQDSYTYTTNIQ